MEKENVLKQKSFQFAVRIVRLFQYLRNKNEWVLSKQVLRSGTSVGAAIREAEHSESHADFIHKMAIGQKEINETLYWIELLHETEYLTSREFNSIHADAIEILKLTTAILKTAKAT